jgi:hypothetical protein
LGGLIATNVFVDFAENVGHGFLGRPASAGLFGGSG